MNVQVVYCSHQTANLAVRERLAFAPPRIGEAYTQLRSRFPGSEVVVLSTCNRIELYTAQLEPAHGPTPQDLAHFLSEFHNVPLDEFFGDLLERTGADAVRHLFQVASSVDSLVLGEPQIVAQVREAYRRAQEFATSGPVTNALFERALLVAKRVRSETRLAEGRVSIASVAVGEFGRGIFERFDDKTILILGAGEMAEETLRYLRSEGAGDAVFVCNRTPERGAELARRWNGTPVPWDDRELWLKKADVVVSTTGTPLIDRARYEALRKTTRRAPQLILDLGTPRDFDPAIRDVDDNVFLYCIDDLETICARNRKARQAEVERALAIIDEETEELLAALAHKATGPIIQRLRGQWKNVVETESQRLFSKLQHLAPADREEIERTMERMVNKLLHPPLEALRDESRSGTPHGLLSALKRLFRLP